MKSKWQELNQQIITCKKCERLVEWREEVSRVKRKAYLDCDYWGKPVPGFGDPQARIMVVGLAPGAHGSNRTGRMFTGDASGDFLFPALYQAGFASGTQALSREDGLGLKDMFITAVGRCAPPGNKPVSAELNNCQPFLLAEMDLLENMQGIIALGKVAWDRSMRILRDKGKTDTSVKFAHQAFLPSEEGFPWMLASYHPSRQNTQTGRLTKEMFAAVWEQARELLI